MRVYVTGAFLVVAAVFVVKLWPDIQRYRRIRDM